MVPTLLYVALAFITSPRARELAEYFMRTGIRPDQITWEMCEARTKEQIRAQVRAELDAETS